MFLSYYANLIYMGYKIINLTLIPNLTEFSHKNNFSSNEKFNTSPWDQRSLSAEGA